MKRKTVFITAAIVGIAAINFGLLAARHEPTIAPVSPSEHRSAVVAGPGRVEALSEEVRVSAQVGGRLQAVLVDENDRVTTGQVLAVIENADYRARLASADASLRLREADARRVHNGARDQERRDAAAVAREAEAILSNAGRDVERRRGLFRETVISRAELDESEKQLSVAQARRGGRRRASSWSDRLRHGGRVWRSTLRATGGTRRAGARAEKRAHRRSERARGHQDSRDARRADGRPRPAARAPCPGIHRREAIDPGGPRRTPHLVAYHIRAACWRSEVSDPAA